MNCSEVQEYISAAVDGEIDTTRASEIDEHIRLCVKCRIELELERMTKHIVSNNLQRVRVPRALAADILAQLPPDVAGDEQQPGWLDTFVDLLRWRTAFTVAGAAVIILLLTFIPAKSRHSHAQPNDDDMIHQTYNNFDRVLDGKIVPTMASADPGAVKAYFTSKTKFNVNVPRLKRCALIGGIFSEYKNEGLAHVMYRHDNKVIYMYQAKLCTVMGSGCLHLPQEAKRELQQTGWYFENHSPDCSLVVWVVDSTVCCAIADINKDQLLACLKDTE